MKPTFQAEMLATQKGRLLQEKIDLLAYDPHPDGEIKKTLHTSPLELCMLRAGDYRIFYTLQRPFVTLLALRSRKAFASPDGIPSAAEVAHLLGTTPAPIHWDHVSSFTQPSVSPEQEPLPMPLTANFLHSLRIPALYHHHLFQVETRHALLNCPGVPPECLRRLDASLFERPLADVMQEETYLMDRRDDGRYQEGSLHTSLLLLAPEQEQAVTRAAEAKGPVQVKGKPGTGKSTVALYRIRSFIQKQREAGSTSPRILFATYTNTLVETSKQLLEQLLETHMDCVKVSTADALIRTLFGEGPREASANTLSELLRRALQQTLPEEAERRIFLSKHSEPYLLEEIDQYIIARKICTEASYITLNRTGRKVSLRRASERKIIWRLYEHFCTLLRQHRQETWSQWRLRAEDALTHQMPIIPYDAVFVDEAQDLDPSVLRILLMVCKAPNRFFITADANQSIYNKGFSWSGIHEDLNFRGGRTIALKTNYRSTRQIGEAAEAYLRAGGGEIEADEWSHANNGSLPAMRTTADGAEEAQRLCAFFNEATRTLHTGLQNCAILCPTWSAGKQLVQALDEQGVKATFLARREIDLAAPGVKVLTLYSSKGLEFPIVALAGFHDSPYVQMWEQLSDEEREEKFAQERRLLFVGMTRAMKALLVLVPGETGSPLFSGFDPPYWHVQ